MILFSSISGATTHQDQTFEIPEYENNEEILLEFIAPFLLVYLILQLGLYLALQAILDVDDPKDPYRKKDKSTARKYSSLIALVMSLMIVVSPFFQQINEITFLLFGTITHLLMLGAILLFLYIIISALLGGNN